MAVVTYASSSSQMVITVIVGKEFSIKSDILSMSTSQLHYYWGSLCLLVELKLLMIQE